MDDAQLNKLAADDEYSSSSVSIAPGEVIIGTLTSIDMDGQALVDFSLNPSSLIPASNSSDDNRSDGTVAAHLSILIPLILPDSMHRSADFIERGSVIIVIT